MNLEKDIEQPWDFIKDNALADYFRFSYGWKNINANEKRKKEDIQYLKNLWNLSDDLIKEYTNMGYDSNKKLLHNYARMNK